MKNDSPPSMLRLSDFMMPPRALASIATPALWAIIAPDSALTVSLGAMTARATEKLGLWRIWSCMRPSVGGTAGHLMSECGRASARGGLGLAVGAQAPEGD